MNESKSIAFFDFDGTTTNRDIFWDYVFFRLKNGFSILKVISCIPTFALYMLKVLNNESAKQRIFGRLFKNESAEEFKAGIDTYYQTVFLNNRLRKDAVDRINWHKQSNHLIYMVSANFDLLLRNFVNEHDLKLISTQIEIRNNILTGNFATPNCYGPEKAVRINIEVPDLNSFEKIYAYGDSKGDLQMLDLATEKFYCFFKK